MLPKNGRGIQKIYKGSLLSEWEDYTIVEKQ